LASTTRWRREQLSLVPLWLLGSSCSCNNTINRLLLWMLLLLLLLLLQLFGW